MSAKLKVKPLNLSKRDCTAVSSNCVLWQGPDIPCLDICKGASITEVMCQIAISFCNFYEQLSPETYNLECLDIDQCAVPEFKNLFQAVIDRLCYLEAGGCNIIVDIVRTKDQDYQAVVTGGTSPYTYQWTALTASFSDVVPSLQNANTQVVSVTPTVPINLKVTVTDANGCKANSTVGILNT